MRHAIAIVCIVLLCAASGAADETSADYTRAHLSFIQELFSAKRYFDCIAETRRYLNYEQGIEKRREFEYFIGANYYLGGQYATAARLMEAPPDGGEWDSWRLLRSQALAKLHRSGEALNVLEGISKNIEDPFLRYEIFLRKADLLISLKRYGDIQKEIDFQEKFFSGSRRLAELRDDIAACESIQYREKSRAALYSAAFPGAGQAWAGRYLDSIISLAAVAGAGYGAWYCHRRGDDGLAYTFMFFTALFYGGNIYGAWNAAEWANSAAHKRFAAALREKYIPPYHPTKYSGIPGAGP